MPNISRLKPQSVEGWLAWVIRRARLGGRHTDGRLPDWYLEKWPQPDRRFQLLRQHCDWRGDRRRHLRHPLQKTQRN